MVGGRYRPYARSPGGGRSVQACRQANELKDEFGSRISVASHALLAEQPAAVATAIEEWIGTL